MKINGTGYGKIAKIVMMDPTLSIESKAIYIHRNLANPQYSYSMQAVELIVGEIKKDPEHIIERLREKVKK